LVLGFVFVLCAAICYIAGHVSKTGTTREYGTTVDVEAIRKMVANATMAVQETPTCMHDVHDPAGANTMDLPQYFLDRQQQKSSSNAASI
jgi:hypothetical protein